MSWGKLLSAVPTTGRDNVVEMEPRDKHEMPASVAPLWRSIMVRRDQMHDLEMKRASIEATKAELVAQAERNIAELERQIGEHRRKLEQEYERWLMLSRTLGIDIQDEPEGEAP